MSDVTVHWRIRDWFSGVPENQLALLRSLHEELLRYHLSLNLVSPRTIPMADAIHFADSILGSLTIQKASQDIDEIYDFGSGNGFPGLVFAILFPSIKVVLVDVDVRKCEYLKAVSHKLSLKNIQVMNIQADKLPPGSVKFGMSRGFANISKSVLMLRKVFAPKGVYFHFKSEEWSKEVAEMPTALCSFWIPELVGEYKLPIGEVKFAIVKTVRTSKAD